MDKVWLRCPRCGQTEDFRIQATTVIGVVKNDAQDPETEIVDPGMADYDPDSPCHCCNDDAPCEYEGPLSQFEVVHESASEKLDNWYRRKADEIHGSEGSIEIDDNALVSRGDDHGAYVQAWVWVDGPDLECQECGLTLPDVETLRCPACATPVS